MRLTSIVIPALLLAVALFSAPSPAAAAELPAFQIVAKDGKLIPNRLEVPAGVKFKLMFRNDGLHVLFCFPRQAKGFTINPDRLPNDVRVRQYDKDVPKLSLFGHFQQMRHDSSRLARPHCRIASHQSLGGQCFPTLCIEIIAQLLSNLASLPYSIVARLVF